MASGTSSWLDGLYGPSLRNLRTAQNMKQQAARKKTNPPTCPTDQKQTLTNHVPQCYTIASTILQTKLTTYFLFTMCNVLSDCTESPLGTPKTSLASSMISLPALMFLFCKWIVCISNLTILVMRFWSIRLDLAPLARHPAQAHTN